jgi:signal transduction histidine kinase
VLSSLTNRIFVAMAGLTVLSIAASTYYAVSAVTAQAEGELRRGLEEAETLVEEYRRLLLDHFAREARLVADLPLLKAAVATNDPPTVQPIAETLREQLGAGLLIVSGSSGAELARVSTPAEGGILQEVSTPIWIDPAAPQVLGTLTVGFWLDARIAARFRELTNSEIAFGAEGRIHTSTLSQGLWPELVPLLAADGLTPTISVGAQDYIASTVPLLVQAEAGAAARPAGRTVILRSRSERLQFLSGVYRTVVMVAIGAVLIAILASYAIARTVTRPIDAVVEAMRQMGSTGDLTRRMPLPSGAGWDDEDAQVLASTFNAMTDSIARFQREAAQRERLSSLGRLSAVIAHEIRNPLMIIKTTLRTLRRQEISRPDFQTAVDDIDGEVTRLNRLVSEVLDFARPLTFELSRVDLNALCADAVKAVWTGSTGPPVRLDLSPAVPSLETDGERLRLALVNVLMNARQAVEAGAGTAGASVALTTREIHPGRISIAVRDTGAGIPADDLPRIFDPFFTTRASGTGLGLALTRNIIEGLGGSITVNSARGAGTDVLIELPVAPARL